VRLFVGLFPPAGACAGLHRYLTAQRRAVRFTPVERWHVTLAFLGEVDAARLPEVEAAVGSVGARQPMSLRIAGGGSFGGRRRGGVLWAGLAGDVAALGQVQADLRAALVAADLPHDERAFTPHLTVAYAVDRDVRAALDAYAGPSWPADRLTLVHSRHAEGGGYDHLRTWPLA
jgi:2'-5' RNA ligase